MPYTVTLVISNVPLLVAAIVGLVLIGRVPSRSARTLGFIGLGMVTLHTVYSLLEGLFLWGLLPFLLMDIVGWLNYAVLAVGLLILVLAATVRFKSVSQQGHAPNQAAPQYPSSQHSAPPPPWQQGWPPPRPDA